MRRPQFTLRTLLVALLVVGAFLGGIRFERERRRRADEAATQAAAMQLRPTPLAIQTVPKRGKIEETFDKFDVPLDLLPKPRDDAIEDD